MRVQFYPSSDLENKLNEESAKLGVNVSTLVNNILNRHYGLIPPNELTDIEIEQKVFAELSEYIKNASTGTKFDLNEASITYRTIDTAYAGKPYIFRARLGKVFANKVLDGEFPTVEQVRVNGKLQKTVENRAALYRIKGDQ